jgi:tRNA threonylcarbamoyladenosine biosynthesis protein TsaE
LERYNQVVEKRIESIKDLEREAQDVIRTLAPMEEATLITLSGELGAGKTTFTQAIARALGVKDAVTSPTFVLEKIYELPEGSAFRRMVHIDAYRLHDGGDLAALGFTELLRDGSNLIVLEWPERVADALPTPAISLMLTPEGDGARTFRYG